MARILMIAYTTYVHDGRVKRHAQALAQRGDHVDLLCLDNPETGMREGVNVIGLRVPRYRGASRLSYFRTYLRFFAAASCKALRLSIAQRYDAAIVCTMPDAAILCALPARLFGSRILLDVHDTMPELYADKFGGRRGAIGARLLRIEERTCAWMASRVLAVHEPHRRRLIKAGVRADKIRVVVNMPDPRIFNGRVRSPSGEFTLVCHGMIARRLGLDVALDAMGRLRETLPDVRLLVIGSGDYLAEIQSMVRERNLAGRVRFMPPMPLERLPEVLRTATVGLVPNRASQVTDLMLPVKLLEYVALGIPVIAARLSTIEHYFPDGVRFFNPGDAADLARAIEQLYREPLSRQRLARRAKSVMQMSGWEKQRQNLYAAIDSLLPPNARRTPCGNDASFSEESRFEERRIEVE